jgi:hypothetical protein
VALPISRRGEERPAQRDALAAKRFLTQALRRHGLPEPITLDGNAATAAAIGGEKAAPATASIIRQGPSVTHLVAPEHRGGPRITRPLLGGNACDAAPCPIAGLARRQRRKKGQLVEEEGAEGLTPAEPCDALSASAPAQPGLSASSLNICDRSRDISQEPISYMKSEISRYSIMIDREF